MSTYESSREIDLSSLPFEATMAWDGATARIDADVPEADLRAAVDAARTVPEVRAQAEADEQAWRNAVGAATSIADLRAVLLGSNTPVAPVVDRKPSTTR